MGANTKLLLSSATAAVVAGGGALTAVVVDLAPGDPISTNSWIVSGVAAAIAAAKDIQAYLAKSPKAL